MTEPRPPTQSPQSDKNHLPHIPIEIVSDEEMALIEAALAATRSSISSSSSPISAAPSSSSSLFSFLSPIHFHRKNARSIQSITLLSKRKLSTEPAPLGDIEDSGGERSTQKRNIVTESFLRRFRRKRGLYVTDITGTEWCEKQMEFFLLFGKPKTSKAMKAGIARHAVLEEEVVKRVEVRTRTIEDIWALKFMNFITGVNQLLFEGLTRELPLIGLVEGVWMVGKIDELRMPIIKTEKNPTLVDTKTRAQATLPAEPQRRNARLQLMCYKYLWDNIVGDNFPSRQFFDFFSLNPQYILSEEIRGSTAKSGFPAETLDDLVRYFRYTCCMLPPAHEQLLLRYELQEDHSLLGEDQFIYDSDWLKSQIRRTLEFWVGGREAKCTPEEERWKCKFCQFASVCPINTNSPTKPS